MKNHEPIFVTRSFPEDTTEYVPTREGLWLPEVMQEDTPLVVCIPGCSEPPVKAYTAAGFGVLVLAAHQPELETDPESFARFAPLVQSRLQEALDSEPRLSREKLYLDSWMSMGLTAEIALFRAAVQRPALSDRASAWGNCAAGWCEPFGDSPMQMLRSLSEQSVITCVDRCRTPLLVLYQEGNPRYSREQSEIFYSAMKDRNQDIPCRLAIFPEQADQARIHQEILNWWNRFSEMEAAK